MKLEGVMHGSNNTSQTSGIGTINPGVIVGLVMGGLLAVALIILLIVLGYWCIKRQSARSSLPPGPWNPPVIGNLRLMKTEAIKLFDKLRKTYGDIFTIYLGNRPLVVVNNFTLCKEVFVDQQQHTYYRPTGLYAVDKLTQKTGVALLGDKRQPALRKWILAAFHSSAKRDIIEVVQEEARYLCREINFQGDASFDPKKFIFPAVVNCVYTTVFGDRNEYDDKEYQVFLAYLESFMEHSAFVFPDNYISFLPYLRKNAKLEDRFIKEQEMMTIIRKKISEQEKTFNARKLRGMADLYIQQKETAQVSDDDMVRSVMDLFMAGTETTTTAVRWCIVFMLRNPDVQMKCRNEIKQKLGNSKIADMQDCAVLTYTHAAIREALRIGNTTSTTQFHMANENFTVNGYEVPAGTLLLGNLYRVHTDEALWEEPLKYNPERWIDGEKVIERKDYIPFGMGPRDCIGGKLAWAEVFIFMVTMLQRFHLKNPDGDSPPTLEATQGLTLSPLPFDITATATD